MFTCAIRVPVPSEAAGPIEVTVMPRD